jgi:hypothetical protein
MTQKDFRPTGRNGGPQERARGSETERAGQPNIAEGASDVAETAKQTARNLAGEAKSQANERLSSKKDKAAEGLDTMAHALRGTKEEIGDKVPYVGDYAERAADGVQRLSEYVRSRNIGELVDDVERFARREPAMFYGGAFALGLLAGRFLKSSSHRDHDRDFGEPDYTSRDVGSFGIGDIGEGQNRSGYLTPAESPPTTQPYGTPQSDIPMQPDLATTPGTAAPPRWGAQSETTPPGIGGEPEKKP